MWARAAGWQTKTVMCFTVCYVVVWYALCCMCDVALWSGVLCCVPVLCFLLCIVLCITIMLYVDMMWCSMMYPLIHPSIPGLPCSKGKSKIQSLGPCCCPAWPGQLSRPHLAPSYTPIMPAFFHSCRQNHTLAYNRAFTQASLCPPTPQPLCCQCPLFCQTPALAPKPS